MTEFNRNPSQLLLDHMPNPILLLEYEKDMQRQGSVFVP